MSNETGNWEVTAKGLENKYEDYSIEKERLLNLRDDCYDWPLHLAEKEWVDIEFLLLRFEEALIKHYTDEVDRERLNRSKDEARKIKKDCEEFDAKVKPSYTSGRFKFYTREDLSKYE